MPGMYMTELSLTHPLLFILKTREDQFAKNTGIPFWLHMCAVGSCLKCL